MACSGIRIGEVVGVTNMTNENKGFEAQVAGIGQVAGVGRVADASGSAGVAVVGYGTAGVNAVIALRNAGYQGPVNVFTDSEIQPYSPILTSYYVGGEKTYEECFPWCEADLAKLDVCLHAGFPVLELDPEAHKLRTEQGEFGFEKCLIATGAKPVLFGFPQVEGYEPIVLRTMAHAERFKAAIEADSCKRVLVSGASMIALKSLEACLRRGVEVELVGMNPHVLDMSALPKTAERFERGLLAKGVQLRLGQTIASVALVDCEGGEGAVAVEAAGSAEAAEAAGFVEAAEGIGSTRKLEVTFSSGDVELFDEIVVAHGVRSDLSFVKAGSLEIDRALVVDEFMRTSNPDVYAVGDVAQALELVSGEKRVLGIWKTAAMQGATAGAAIAAEMAGEQPAASAAYKGAISSNTIAVDGTLFISGGSVELGEGRSVEFRETTDMTVACVFDESAGKRKLVGFNVACDVDEPGGLAYDTGAMLHMRIEREFRAR